jgi:hypothetical protein
MKRRLDRSGSATGNGSPSFEAAEEMTTTPPVHAGGFSMMREDCTALCDVNSLATPISLKKNLIEGVRLYLIFTSGGDCRTRP